MQPSSSYPTVTQQPASVGISAARLDHMDRVLQGYVDAGQLAGFVTLVARRGAVVDCRCYGMADIAAGLPMRPDTIFRIYSMTKPIVAAALLTLYEEGRFLLDDPVAKYMPAFKRMRVWSAAQGEGYRTEPQKSPITIRQLCTHTSGLVYPSAAGGAERAYERWLWEHWGGEPKGLHKGDLAAWIEDLVQIPLAHQPGTTYHYGISIDVLGRLCEALSGQKLDVFLNERIFQPLGMADTAFWVPPEKLGRFTALYAPDEEGKLLVLERRDEDYAQQRLFLSGGGGLVATTADYLRFAQMLLGGGQLDGVRVLGRKTVELMCSNHLKPELQTAPGWGYGLGGAVLLDPGRAGQSGSPGLYRWSGAAGTDFWVDPKEELIGLIMPQTMGQERRYYPVGAQFQSIVYGALVD